MRQNISTTEDFALINDRTPYREIKYLLANHYLDLKTGKSFGFGRYPIVLVLFLLIKVLN